MARWVRPASAFRSPRSAAASKHRTPTDRSTNDGPVVLVVEDEQPLQDCSSMRSKSKATRPIRPDEYEARREAARLGHIDVLIDVVLLKGELAAMITDLRTQCPALAVVLITGRQATEEARTAGIQAPVLAAVPAGDLVRRHPPVAR